MTIQVLDLGIKDYKETLDIQYELIEKRKNRLIEDTLIFVEHPHVITAGRKSHENNILEKSLPIYYIERGGDITYHGPGQLIGYPIIDINNSKDINLFLRKIEQILIETLDIFDIKANRKEKYTGVWTQDKKIVSIGIAFKNWISYHGFALNISTDMDYFFKINPCGLDASIMTSMDLLLGKKTDKELVKKIIHNIFIKSFL